MIQHKPSILPAIDHVGPLGKRPLHEALTSGRAAVGVLDGVCGRLSASGRRHPSRAEPAHFVKGMLGLEMVVKRSELVVRFN